MTNRVTPSTESVVTILGNGAIGNLLLMGCYQRHIPVQLLTRSDAPSVLKASALDGSEKDIVPISIKHGEPIAPGVVILPLKAYQIIPGIRQIAPLLTPLHTVVLLHNGMGTLEQASDLLVDIPLIVATTSYGAFKPDISSVRATGKGKTQAGWIRKGTTQQTEYAEHLLDTLLPPCDWYPDVQLPLWNKLAINAVINPLTAIHKVKNGQLADEQFETEIRRLCNETAEVMTASGYQASSDTLVSACYEVIDNTAENYSSMYQDINHNRKSEIDFINGYIVERAQAEGLSVPRHQAMLKEVKAKGG